MSNLLELMRRGIVSIYPHLDNGVLEECLQVSYVWGLQVILSLTATFVVCLIILSIFNHVFNIIMGDKKAAAKFWAAVYKKL